MSREDCDYAIDRALATGGLDSGGNIIFPVKGTREEIVDQILERAGNWGPDNARAGQGEGRRGDQCRCEVCVAANFRHLYCNNDPSVRRFCLHRVQIAARR
jgi:hypothetical protein